MRIRRTGGACRASARRTTGSPRQKPGRATSSSRRTYRWPPAAWRRERRRAWTPGAAQLTDRDIGGGAGDARPDGRTPPGGRSNRRPGADDAEGPLSLPCRSWTTWSTPCTGRTRRAEGSATVLVGAAHLSHAPARAAGTILQCHAQVRQPRADLVRRGVRRAAGLVRLVPAVSQRGRAAGDGRGEMTQVRGSRRQLPRGTSCVSRTRIRASSIFRTGTTSTWDSTSAGTWETSHVFGGDQHQLPARLGRSLDLERQAINAFNLPE